MDSRTDLTALASDEPPQVNEADPHASPLRRLANLHARGPASLANISLYAFGVSGLWTALGTPLLPVKVGEIVEAGGGSLFGISLDKNGALGIVSLIGLAMAALAQPVAGMMSDRRAGPRKRLPYMIAGTAGMAAAAIALGFAGALLTLIVVNMLIQWFGNFGQGAANGLISDHVGKGAKGRAAGALNLSRVAGAGMVTAAVLLFMRQYDKDTSPGWFWVSLSLMAIAAIGAMLWTVTSLMRKQPAETVKMNIPASELERKEEPEKPGPVSSATGYLRFLIALSFVITGFSALQLYSFFYLEDVIGLENAADGGIVILLTTGAATALVVMPAGRLTDLVGRDMMLYVGGAVGVLASIILIFAQSVIVVALDGLLMGVAIGIFLTVSWALANDLVSQRNAARDLGYASIAVLIGSATARIAGIGVDYLNGIQHALGYQAVLGAVGMCFVITVFMMTRLGALDEPGPAAETAAAEPARASEPR
jgi:MFS family permease